MKCERCEDLMRGEPLMIVVEPFSHRLLAMYHCMNCKRVEYGTTSAEAVLNVEGRLAA